MTTSTNGKICYLQIPATDPQASAEFYRRVFGWNIRTHGDGTIAFDDSTGQVSGAFLTGRPPLREIGILIYVMVDDAEAAVTALEAAGAEIVQPLGGDAPEITARFRDPGGNVLGIYQEPA